MKYAKNLFALLLSLTFSIGIFAGCTPQTEKNPSTTETLQNSETEEQTTALDTEKTYSTLTAQDVCFIYFDHKLTLDAFPETDLSPKIIK